MIDIQAILKDLQDQAGELARQVDVEKHAEQAKDAARKIKDRLENDPKARNIAIGSSALLAILMASKGGRKIVGNVAKTGTVAALGALAYQAWKNRQNETETGAAALAGMGYAADDVTDPAMSQAIVETMIAAAHTDGHLDADEDAAITKAVAEAGIDPSVLKTGQSPEATLDRIVAAAQTPNHAAQLFAAACVATGDTNSGENKFLVALADRLAIHPRKAEEMRAALA